jgi:mannose-6-phosphate isomerase-like protein (cupin superfamily)
MTATATGQAGDDSRTHDPTGRRVVIRPSEFGRGAPMEVGREGVRDLKVIYPETGFDAATLCFGIVEIDPGRHSPLHRHRCEEMYHVLQGAGEVEQAGELFPIAAGDAVLNRPDVVHRVHNRGEVTLRLAVVAGIMLVPLLATWPTPGPYEILE